MNTVESLSDDELACLLPRALALPDAPEALIRAAIDLWPVTTPMTDEAMAAWRLVVATQTFDSWAASRAPVVRSVASDTRHLMFSASGRDIDLRITPAGERFCIVGQVLAADTAGSIELVTRADAAPGLSCAHAVPLDAMGEFRLDDIRSGTYHMTLRMAGDEILLPPIDVGLGSRCVP